MTEIYRTISTAREDDVSPSKCRERRRRRIKMRRQAADFGDPSSSSLRNRDRTEHEVYSSFHVPLRKQARRSEIGGLPADMGGFFTSRQKSETPVWKGEETEEPLYGIVSVMGRSRKMEDAVTVKPNFSKPEINQKRPVHFFGVYDGHGGSQVSTLCSTTMHTLIKEEVEKNEEEEEGSVNDVVVEKKWRGVMNRSYKRMDELATSTCVCGSSVPLCNCDPREAAISGSTAVAAVLTQEHIVVANTGDSRAVLCRSGVAIPLSNDHKPDRPDERARIEAAGGRVLVVDGARVEGILATSRAIGDRYLKPMVAWEPEVTIMSREPGDECLILASDGLWDVLSSQLACDVARFCLREEATSSLDLNLTAQEDDNRGEQNPSRSALAATLLTRLALGRQSNDNISVIVIDLKNSSR
ncbi:putative protein phosphatase 2C 75 [Cardamine amara subsp. amara]|uniref:protein-serine/threonine phosphatase n=1 Tax=Cardamine amara subsp. amara TaxID=228776 RepID=A0ABD1B830_CARAN